jgi:hypothetical protein
VKKIFALLNLKQKQKYFAGSKFMAACGKNFSTPKTVKLKGVIEK